MSRQGNQEQQPRGGSVLMPPSVRPVTRRIVSDRDSTSRISRSVSPDARNTESTLWKAVRSRVGVSAALREEGKQNRRSRMFEDERRFDDEGLTSDTLRADVNHLLAPGQYAEQWQSLAHLFDPDAQGTKRIPKKKRSKRSSMFVSSSASTSAFVHTQPRPIHTEGVDEPTFNPDDSLLSASFPGPSSLKGTSSIKLRSRLSQDRQSSTDILEGVSRSEQTPDILIDAAHPPIIQEPDSMLTDGAHQTPLGDDPLQYTSQDHLLDSDSDSDSSDSEDDVHGVNIHRFGDARSARSVPVGPPRSSPTTLTKVKNLSSRATVSLKTNMVLTTLRRNILKCALAYFIASLFTYSPLLSRWLSSLLPQNDPDDDVPLSNLHMIATVAVYFHPAKTLGAMIEADFFALGAFLYAVALGFCSMAVAVFLHESNRLIISDIISVLVFLGFGMALVGYAKIKVAKPQFNTACSLVSIIAFTVIVKEGSLHLGRFSTDKTFQVTLVVLAGSLISNLVCFYIWPQSATSNLQGDIVRNLRGFSTLLRVLTKTFLLEDPSNFHFKSDHIKRAIDDHHDSFTSLKKNLAEAKLESLFDLRMRGMSGKYVEATDSLNRLAQHLAGLRSSCGLQHQIMMTRKEAQRDTVDGQAPASMSTSPDTSAFEDFIASVGPHMRSLVFSCCRTLKGLRSTFIAQETGHFDLPAPEHGNGSQEGLQGDTIGYGSTKRGFVPGFSFDGLEFEITSALRRFEHEQTAAIKRIYTMEPKKMEEMADHARDPVGTMPSNLGLHTYNPLSPQSHPDEEIFLIFFFVFNLEEFAKELEVLIEALETIRQAEERIALARQTSWRMRARLFFRTFGSMGKEYRGLLNSRRSRHAAPKKMTTPLDFPSTRRHTLDTHQTPAAMTWKEKLQQLVWSVGEFFRQPDTKFAIKAGVGSAILASPAFFLSTRDVFTKFQGQWALVSFMVVLSPTVGQSNHMSLHRVLGTVLGALAAVSVYTLFPDNNVIMPVFGVLFSIPCFQYIVGKPQLASSGRFVLLTYNLTALYSYNLRKTGIEVEQIAYQRTVSVVVGVMWATLLNQLIWPFEARRQLALGVSDVLFKLAWLYQRLVLSYSENPAGHAVPGGQTFGQDWDDEETALLGEAASRQRDEFQAIELHLQVSLIKLEGLLAQTKHEPRLKGPFPVTTYKSMLGCCQNILDKLHSMRCVTGRQDWYRHVRRDFVIPVNPERREMVGNILLFFYTLGSAFHLKSPVPPYFPPADQCRARLLDKIRELPAVKRRAVRGSSAYLLFYSYALAMKDVIDQLEQLGRLTQQNFGTWGGSVADFEASFATGPGSTVSTPSASKRPSRTRLAAGE